MAKTSRKTSTSPTPDANVVAALASNPVALQSYLAGFPASKARVSSSPSLTFRAFVSEYKGSRVITLTPLDDPADFHFSKLSFGMAKARAIVSCIESIKRFVGTASPTLPASAPVAQPADAETF